MPLNAVCGDCGRSFTSLQARQQHMNALGHRSPEYECDTCDRYFDSWEDAAQHMNMQGHWGDQFLRSTEVSCEFCFDFFDDIEQHEVDCHCYCRPCDRHFLNSNNISQHLKSRVHLGANLSCPFCRKAYTVATGIAHHLESGACPNAPVDRQLLYRAIARYDERGQFTNKHVQQVTYAVTDRAYNSLINAWECYLCHRAFNLRSSLNQHLNSPAHQQALYHCPSTRCGREFSTAGGLFNHLESETCGAMRFDDVQRHAQAMMNPDRLLNYY